MDCITYRNTNILPGRWIPLEGPLVAGRKALLPETTLENVASFENLYRAYIKARKGKSKRPDVAQFGMRWETHLLALSEKLRTGAYIPGDYRIFKVYEKKPRIIMAAPFIDRIVHHAVCNIVQPHLERSMVPVACANRVGLGTRRGLDLFSSYCRRYTYVLKCDVRRFFPSIDRKILLYLISPKIMDKHLLGLIEKILFHAPPGLAVDKSQPDNEPDDAEVSGLPIGNMTSQIWANWYLSRLDHYIMDYRGFGAYVRYVDDFAVFGNDKQVLNALKAECERFIRIELGQVLHPSKSRVYRTDEGVLFLGFRHWPTHRKPSAANIRRFKRRVCSRLAFSGCDDLLFNKAVSTISGWCGHARQGDTYRLRESLRVRYCRGPGKEVPRVAWGLVEQQQSRELPLLEPEQEQS
jgi:RNA-directed DNA polymerase